MITDNESTFEDAKVPGADQTEGKTPASALDREALFKRLRHWFMLDKRHSEDWRRDAENSFDFVAGRQWSAEDLAKLREQMRPAVAFNRIAPVIQAVSGTEVSNRQEVRYLPREQGDAAPDEMLTATAKWFRDECNGEDEESDAFYDMLVCGMGWTETRMDFEQDQDGAPLLERCDPLEMFWDSASQRRNIEDARRVWRVKKVSLDEAKSLVGQYDADDDEDFDASWANFYDTGDKNETRQEARFYRPTKEGERDTPDDLITLVECQWWERETVYAVAGEMGVEFMSQEEYDTALERSEQLGMEAPKVAKQTRRKYFRAWLGATVLADPDESPFGDHFSYNAITGYRDRNKGTFFGLVKSMLDPQQWANKWLSQTMHILNTSAKGGALVEKGAFEDEREAEKNWSSPSNFVYMKQGALSSPNGPKITPKPAAQMPQGYPDLMQFALQSIRDASGVNLELLGAQDREQPGILEAQRKKQALSILATLFDSMRRYRKNQGRLMLWLIQNHVSDGRLVRINGEGSARYIPFIRKPDYVTYDVVVDDAPSSPQQKEITWMVFSSMAPMFGRQMPPELINSMLDYAPIPESAVGKIKQALAQAQQSAAQQAQQAQQAQVAGMQAKISETQSRAALNHVKAMREGAQADMEATQAQVMEAATGMPGMIDDGMGGGLGPMQQPPAPPPQPQGPDINQVMLENQRQIAMLASSMAQMGGQIKSALMRPKRVIRDENGTIVGVD